METQWSLVIFTLFVCLSSGTIAIASYLSLRGKGEKLLMPALITSIVTLLLGGIGSFTHLQHWERIFNGFGHITSGITQELIGVVVMGVVFVAWIVVLRRGKGMPKALAGITIAASVLMVVATAHSYLMPARPAWGIALVAFYLANAFVLGAVAVWIVGIVVHDDDAEKTGLSFTVAGSVVQLAADAIYIAACSMAKFADFGHYADPTAITTAPTHIQSLMDVMVAGPAAGMFWGSLACAAALIVIALVAKKANGSPLAFASIAGVVVLAGSVLFRVLIYMLGYSFVLLY